MVNIKRKPKRKCPNCSENEIKLFKALEMAHQLKTELENERLKRRKGPRCSCGNEMVRYSHVWTENDENGDWLEISELWYCKECVDPTALLIEERVGYEN